MAFKLFSKEKPKAIHELEDGEEYPVAGYHEVLDQVYEIVRKQGAKKVLDLGFGTGNLTRRLYADGIEIVGVDLNRNLVEAAQEDMPNAYLLCEDFELGLPTQLVNEKFDVAIATYSVYNIDDYEKRELMDEVLHHLNPGGLAIVGGIGFENKETRREIMRANRDLKFKCDFPMIKTELKKDYPDATWIQVSKCAHICIIERP